MTTHLSWDSAAGFDGHGLGYSLSGGVRITLAHRPELGFAYDAIEFDDTLPPGRKSTAGVWTDLTAAETIAVTNYLSGYVAMNNASVAAP